MELTEAILNNLSTEERKVFRQLHELITKEHSLCEEINARKPRESGYFMEGGALVPCADEDDWKVVTFKFREDLSNVRKKIARTLERAVELDLDRFGVIQRQVKNYGGE